MRGEATSTLDEICREGARRMLAAALEAEADAYIAELVGETDERGRRLVTRNGHARPRTITTGSGPIEIRAPRVNDRRVDADTGERKRFKSSIVPPWCRKSPKVAEVLPLLYLHGLSTGDFAPALTEFFGSSAGLSPSVVTRLTTQWQAEHRAFMERDLSDRDYVYCWVDGVHFNVHLEQDRLCCLVIVGVRLDGTKELVALLPKSVQPTAKKMLAEIRDAEDRDHAVDAAKRFDAEFRPKWPKAADKIRDDLDRLVSFYDFPAEHWLHLKTSNPIESTFSTVRLRTKVTKGPGSRAAGLAMAYKLIESAQDRWRAVNGPHLVALVRAGAVFKKGVLVENPTEDQVAA
jgi:transposase-like protein